MLKVVSVLIFASAVFTLTLVSALAEEPRSIEIKIINPNKSGPADERSTIPSRTSETPSPSAQSSRDRARLKEIYEYCINETVQPSRPTAESHKENLTYLAQIAKEVTASRGRVDPRFFELADQVINGRLSTSGARNKLRSAATIQGVAVPPLESKPPDVNVTVHPR
jgi:hypothetical protein